MTYKTCFVSRFNKKNAQKSNFCLIFAKTKSIHYNITLMKKLLLLFVLLLLGVSQVEAQGNVRPKLVVWLKSGDKVVYDLTDVPITTFSGNQLVIRTNKATVAYERKNVLRYTYEDLTSNGIEPSPGDRFVEINQEGDEITFRGLQAGSIASIYAVNGTLVD